MGTWFSKFFYKNPSESCTTDQDATQQSTIKHENEKSLMFVANGDNYHK